MEPKTQDSSPGDILLRRFIGGLLACCGIAALYLAQTVAVFMVPAIGGRLIHAAVYYPGAANLLRLIPLVVTFALSLYAPKGRTIVLRIVGLQLVCHSQEAAPSWQQRTLRWLLLMLTAALFGLPLITALMRRDRRALHDVLSGVDVRRQERE